MTTTVSPNNPSTDTLTGAVARQQLEAAQIHLESITGRLSRGDFSVHQDDLSEAQERVSYLEHVVTGAENADRERKAQERDEAGRTLHEEFVSATAQVVGEANTALEDVGRAVTVALDKLDAIAEIRQGFQRRWNEIHRGHTEDPSALLFKVGGVPGGTFGAVAEGRVLPRLDAIEVIEAVIGETIKGRSRGEMSGVDAHWVSQLRQPTIANGLRALRSLHEHFKTKVTENPPV